MKDVPEERTFNRISPVEKKARKPLRILMVTPIYPTINNPHSGTFIKTLVDSLITAGHEVEIIHPKPGPVLFRYATAIIKVFFKTLTGRFDIVHGHFGQWCLFACMQWTTPVVASFLGSDLLGAFTPDGKRTKKGLFVAHLSRWLCTKVDAVTVKTEEMKRAASESNIFVYSDGVDFELFHPIARSEARTALGWDLDSYYILFGNNPKRPEKNFPLARAAIDCLQKRGISAELVVASGLPQTNLVQYINACNVVILTSFSEGSPNIVKEAMACNVPVVSTNVGDVSELIDQTEGSKVCSSDPNALAEALKQALILSEPTTGRTNIAHLKSSIVAEQVIAVYEQVRSKREKKN